MRLEDKVAVVTGAGRGGRGIGRSIALALAGEGADVCVSATTPGNAEAVAAEVRDATGRRAIGVTGNVAEWPDVEAMFRRVVAELGRVDLLVNNAGITRDNLLLRLSEDDWDAVIDSNLKGTFLCTKAAARLMLKQRSGKIVNVSSVMGIVGNAGQANYSASKGGIIALTKTTARELGSRGINVNAVAPGFIETVMTDALPEELRETMKKQVPLARLGTPEDVARVVLFLCTDDSSYLTGQVISIDGGLFM
ncbi:MAG: 3-oxoacyl-[acyl-carrier-protein] reductase [Chthonomonadales bacterium]|nr:3-oxoacyl-[acyl-carrier-protein] reductase [Chthonomonadales bacterium]